MEYTWCSLLVPNSRTTKRIEDKTNIKKEEKLMGFWKEVDIEIRSRMNTFKTSYEDEKGDAIKIIANERYGKK